MARRNVFLGFASGVLTGVVGMIVMMSGEELPRAMAQAPALPALSQVAPPQPVAPGRFQVSAWAYPSSTGSNATSGAYIVDTHSGAVWWVQNGGKPARIGSVQ